MDAAGQTPNEAYSTEELHQRLAALHRLLDVTRQLAGDIDPLNVLNTITRAACEALDCDRASLYEFDPGRNELYTRVVTELEINEVRHTLDVGITGHVARNREVANVPDPPQDPRWDSSVDRETGYRTRSILAGPLISAHDGKLLGVLQLLNKRGGPFGPFDEELLGAFSQHAGVALDRARLIDQQRRRDVVEASLNVARDIQRGFMPGELADVNSYEMASWWFPNEAVGGDYCDVLHLADGRFAMVVADVSGHGLGPSLIMASARAALRALLLEHTAPDRLLELLGRALATDLVDGWFITMVIAVVDPQRHEVIYANAGHAPALHYSAAHQSFRSLESTGVPLGVLDDAVYERGEVLRLGVGDLLFLCTDGIVEAMSDTGEQFGRPRLERLVGRQATCPVKELVRNVGREVESHFAGDYPPDDLTILCARRNG